MPVFYIHEPGRGIITPLSDKYRIRQILDPEELNEAQRTHRKTSPNPENYPSSTDNTLTPGDDGDQGSGEQQSQREGQKAASIYSQTRDQADAQITTEHASSVMSSPVISTTINASLLDAWKKMQQHGINHLVIIDENHLLAGLLSEKQVMPYLIEHPEINPEQLTLEVFCQRTLLSATPDTELHQLAQVMLENRLDGMVIIENNILQGIITYPDIIKVMLRAKQLEAFA